MPEAVVDTAPPTPRSSRSADGKGSNGPSPNGKGSNAPSPAANKGNSVPSKLSRTPSSAASPTVNSTSAEQEAALRARVLAYGEELDKALAASGRNSSDSGSESGGEGDESAMPDANVKYATLKVQLSEVQRAQAAQKRATKGRGDRKGTEPVSVEQEKWMEAQVEVLQERIKAVESDYTFRKVDAEKVYRAERTKLDASQLAARLNGTSLASVPSAPSDATSDATGSLAPSAPISEGTTPASTANGKAGFSSPPSPSASANGVSDNKGDDEGFFGTMLDEMPTEEQNDQGTTIPVRNMALPKHFSGRTPRVCLEDTVRKLDRGARVKFAVVSRSRAVRASVTIYWTPDDSATPRRRVQYFDMQDIACWDQKQAYDYIATVALFAIAMSPQGNGMAINKALPTIFRDLWDDFLAERTAQEEERYREKLKLYKAIAEPRCQDSPNRVSWRWCRFRREHLA